MSCNSNTPSHSTTNCQKLKDQRLFISHVYSSCAYLLSHASKHLPNARSQCDSVATPDLYNSITRILRAGLTAPRISTISLLRLHGLHRLGLHRLLLGCGSRFPM